MRARMVIMAVGGLALLGCAGPTQTTQPGSGLETAAVPAGGAAVQVPVPMKGRWVARFAADGSVEVIQKFYTRGTAATQVAALGAWYRNAGGQLCYVESSTWEYCFSTFGWVPAFSTQNGRDFDRRFAGATEAYRVDRSIEVAGQPGSLAIGAYFDRNRGIYGPGSVARLDYPGLGDCVLIAGPSRESREPYKFTCGARKPVTLTHEEQPDGAVRLTGRYGSADLELALPAGTFD